MKRKLLINLTLLSLSLAVLSFIPNAEAKSPKKIKLARHNVVMSVGEKATVKVKSMVMVKWKSSNRKVATVSSKGIVKAKSTGKAKLTAKYAMQKEVCTVSVVKIKDKVSIPLSNQVNNVIKVQGYESTQKPVVCSPPCIPTSTPTVTPTPAVSSPLCTPSSVDNPGSDEQPKLCVDIWLLFGIDQNITTDTTTISGTMTAFKNTVIKIKVNGSILAEKSLVENGSSFSINTNFSNIKEGDTIEISREYIGNNTQQTDNESIAIHNVTKTFYLGQSS